MDHRTQNVYGHTIHVKHFVDPHTRKPHSTVYVTLGEDTDSSGAAQLGRETGLTEAKARALVTKYVNHLRKTGSMKRAR